MNVIKSNWFCSLLIFAVGVTLCCLYDRTNVLVIIVYMLGTLFTVTGCINIITTSMRYSKGETNVFSVTVGWLAGLGGVGLGAAMLIVPGSFVNILVYVFAALLVLGGLWHFLVLSSYYKKSGIPGWLYFIPLIILVGGVVMFCSQSIRDNTKVSILMSGIGAILYGIATLLEYIFSKAHAKQVEKAAETVDELKVRQEPVTQEPEHPTPDTTNEVQAVSTATAEKTNNNPS